jgi:hypothetical protein
MLASQVCWRLSADLAGDADNAQAKSTSAATTTVAAREPPGSQLKIMGLLADSFVAPFSMLPAFRSL